MPRATGVGGGSPPPSVDKAVSGFLSKRKSRLGLTHVIERHRKAEKVEKGRVCVPLSHREEFLARLQKGNRIQIPVLIRWKHKLESNEFLKVDACNTETVISRSFYVKLSSDGRFVIPKIVVEELEVKPKDLLEITLDPTTT